MSSSDARPDEAGPFDDYLPALRGQAAACTDPALAATFTAVLDEGLLPLVLPADVHASIAASSDPRAALVAELERCYRGPHRRTWRALLDGRRVSVVVITPAGSGDEVPADLGVEARRVTLAPGQVARHPRSGRPRWVVPIGFGLVAVAVFVLAWSYDMATWLGLVLAAVLAAAYAGTGVYPPLRPRRPEVGTWPAVRRLAGQGAALGGALGSVTGLLASDGLVARDAALVLLSLSACGAWAGGGDLVAVMAAGGPQGTTVADLGAVRVSQLAPA